MKDNPSYMEETFKEWQKKYPYQFPPDRPLASYVELDPEQKKLVCNVEGNKAVLGTHILKKMVHEISSCLEYEDVLFAASVLCPACLALGGSGVVIQEYFLRMKITRDEYGVAKRPVYDNGGPPRKFEPAQFRCPLED